MNVHCVNAWFACVQVLFPAIFTGILDFWAFFRIFSCLERLFLRTWMPNNLYGWGVGDVTSNKWPPTVLEVCSSTVLCTGWPLSIRALAPENKTKMVSDRVSYSRTPILKLSDTARHPHKEVIQGILHALGAGSVPCKGCFFSRLLGGRVCDR